MSIHNRYVSAFRVKVLVYLSAELRQPDRRDLCFENNIMVINLLAEVRVSGDFGVAQQSMSSGRALRADPGGWIPVQGQCCPV